MAQEKKQYIFKTIYHEIAVVSIVSMMQLLSQGCITLSLSTMEIVLDDFARFSTTPIDSTIKIWFMGSFALTMGTFILISGKLGDLFGLKMVFNIGWIWVILSSLITGLSYYSKSIIFYIFCRAIQGIGFALLLPCGMGILGNIYPNGTRKNVAFACVGAAGPTGAALGALFAGIIAQLYWWPWCFYLISILGFVLLGLSYLFIPNNLNQLPTERAKKFDYIGSFVGVTGLILLNFTVNQGPTIGWKTAYIIVLLILSVFLIIGFFIIESYVSHPLLPKSVYNYKIGLVLLCIALGWGSFGIWQYYYWVIILELRQYSPIIGGLTYIPILVLGIVAAFLVAFLISRIKPSFIILFSCMAFCGGSIMLCIMPIDQTFWKISFGQLLILSWGMDLSFAAASIILSDYLPKRHQGLAGSLVSTVINYFVSFFLGLSGSIEVELVKANNDALSSYRGAIYFGVGISGLSAIFAFVFLMAQYYNNDSKGTFEAIDEKEDDY